MMKPKDCICSSLMRKEEKRIEEVCRIVTDVNEQIAYLRSSVIGALIKECTRVFTENEEKILTGGI